MKSGWPWPHGSPPPHPSSPGCRWVLGSHSDAGIGPHHSLSCHDWSAYFLGALVWMGQGGSGHGGTVVGSLELLSSWGGATWEKARETGKVNRDRGLACLPLLPHLLGGEGGLSGILRCPAYSDLLPLLLRQGLMPFTLESEDGAPSTLSAHNSNGNQSLSWQIHPHPNTPQAASLQAPPPSHTST